MKKCIFLFVVMAFAVSTSDTNIYAGPYTEGLVGYWNFENGGTDLSTNNNTGSLNESAQYTTDQDFLGQSLYLSGGYFSAPFHEDYNFTDSYSLVLWVKEESTSLGTLISRWAHASSERSYELQTNWVTLNSVTNIFSYDGSAFDYNRTDATVALNEWYQVAVTYDGTQMKIFLNGIPFAPYSYSNDINTSSAQLLLGAVGYYENTVDTRYRFYGYIDEVEMFNIALTDEQVMNDYFYVLTGELPTQTIPEPISIILLGIAISSRLIVKRLG